MIFANILLMFSVSLITLYNINLMISAIIGIKSHIRINAFLVLYIILSLSDSVLRNFNISPPVNMLMYILWLCTLIAELHSNT
ncbi:MAG: hypothetical protein IJZ90_00675, partial [Clostridia bacterium]|nr:hypothetical protein [Clostridia bacterium]